MTELWAWNMPVSVISDRGWSAPRKSYASFTSHWNWPANSLYSGKCTVVPMKGIKNFILVYVALRSFLAIFYGVNIVAGLNILELVGFFFPVVLLSYWAMTNFRTVRNNYVRFYLFVATWVLTATVLKMLSYGFSGIQSFSGFFRVLNGFAVFAVFPLIFKDQKSINSLMNAFFIMTLFPLLQGLTQFLLGADIGGMRIGTGMEQGSEFISYFGLYYKYGGYAWAALCGGLIMIYKVGIASKINKKRGYIYGLFFFLYLLLASMTLSRVLVFSMLIVIITMVMANTSKKAKPQMIIAFLILLAFIIIGSGYVKDRYEQIMARSEKEFQVVSGEADVEGAFHGRVGLWKYKLGQFHQRSFVERLTGTNIVVGPHSDYVEWILQYGYVGIILYSTLFFGLLVSSIKTFSRINRMHGSYLQPYGLMVIAGLVIWLMEGIIHNSSKMPDYAYFVIGNAAIFLSMGKKMLGQRSSSWASFPLRTA